MFSLFRLIYILIITELGDGSRVYEIIDMDYNLMTLS